MTTTERETLDKLGDKVPLLDEGRQQELSKIMDLAVLMLSNYERVKAESAACASAERSK